LRPGWETGMPMTLAPANAVSANTGAALTPPTSQIPRDDFWQLETVSIRCFQSNIVSGLWEGKHAYIIQFD
jgi:hypothetical protein